MNDKTQALNHKHIRVLAIYHVERKKHKLLLTKDKRTIIGILVIFFAVVGCP